MNQLSVRLVMDKVLHAPKNSSLKKELAELNEILPNLSPRRNLEILYAIYRFAPEVRLHPNDIYRPTSVPWYLQRVRMRRHRAWWPDVNILNPHEVTVRTLISQRSGGQSSGSGTSQSNFFLETVLNKPETRRGLLAIAPTYVHIRKDPDNRLAWDIQYWFFYSYNGDITSGANVGHEGDWEHVTVRTNFNATKILKIFYHAHYSESEWRDIRNVDLTNEGRPIAYSSKHSHAHYWNAGKQVRNNLPDDHTADGGPRWKTWDNIQMVGVLDKPWRGEEWIKYTGRWGEIGTPIISFLSGPYGPAFQRYWERDS